MIQAINGTYLTCELEDNFVKSSRIGGNHLDRIKEINILPFPNLNIFFSDDVWDFSSARNVNIKKSDLIFKFDRVCEHYKEELKKYILSKLFDGDIKIQSIHVEAFTIVRFLNYAFKRSYYAVSQFERILVESYLQTVNGLSKSYQWHNVNAIKSFLLYYSAHYENVLTPELEELLDYHRYAISTEEKELRKTPDIPQAYYNRFLESAIRIVDSNDIPKRIKAGTCVLLLLSQTGLRISEILDLRCGALASAASYSKAELFYLKYRTWKREHGNHVFTIEKVFANSLTKKAYDVLMNMYTAERALHGYEYLYLGNLRKQHPLDLPISNDHFAYIQREIYTFMNRYFPTINLPEKDKQGLSTCGAESFSLMKTYYSDARTLTYPTTIQFRVHVCSELYAKGCPLAYIQRFMGHLSYEMAGYYVRTGPKDSQEDLKYAQKIFKEIVTDKVCLLGNGADNLKSRIDVFIQEKGFKIEQDMDAILSILTDKMPVRQKTGGVCIRSSSVRECSKDAMTNEFYCAYGVCPNIFHFFYMVEVSYRQASELYESITLNHARGFMRQAYKESLMLHTLAEQKLIPELDELKKEIGKRGHRALIEEYPELEYIVTHLDSVREEASRWKDCSI